MFFYPLHILLAEAERQLQFGRFGFGQSPRCLWVESITVVLLLQSEISPEFGLKPLHIFSSSPQAVDCCLKGFSATSVAVVQSQGIQ